MPVPLIPVLAAGAVVLLVSAGARAVLAKSRGSRTVAVLGRQRVGKSTLVRSLTGAKVDFVSSMPERRARDEQLSLQFLGKQVNIVVPRDPGTGFSRWEQALHDADQVWYIFRADRIAEGDPDECEAVEHDLGLIRHCVAARKLRRPRIILVGTWADRIPRYEQDPGAAQRRVAAASVLHIGAVQLDDAPIIVGSLSSEQHAAHLVAALREELV